MLTIDKLCVEIAGSSIITNLDLEVKAGELACLIGRNGAGKTTTFKTIMGYRRPKSGSIRFEGREITGLPTWKVAQLGIGFSPEESEVYGDLTVAENIELATWTRPDGTPAGQRLARAYGVFPKLRAYMHRGGMQLSGGERKMVSIARALALDPKLLLLDEPFEGLSPAIIPIIGEGICALRDMGQSILMAESNVHHIPDFVDRLFVIERGELIFSGPLSEAFADRQVMRVIAGELDEMGLEPA